MSFRPRELFFFLFFLLLYIGLCTSANGKCCHHHDTTSGWTGCGLFQWRWPLARRCWGMMGEWEGWRGERPRDVVRRILGMWYVFFFPFSFYFHITNFFFRYNALILQQPPQPNNKRPTQLNIEGCDEDEQRGDKQRQWGARDVTCLEFQVCFFSFSFFLFY